jgi:Creatinase/Prolidase N-terminal domain
MRRGLIARSRAELPDAVFDARLERLRAAMAGLDALLIYTNNTRPAGVSWLVGFIPYWSEAMLVLPRTGPPVLVVALTFRVKPWIERTSRVAEVIFNPRIGIETARLVAAKKADAAVGVVDFDHLSAGIADDLREAGPRLAFSDASELFAALRASADPTEIMLAARASSIAASALSRIDPGEPGIGAIVAAVEGEARRLGAEEVYVAAAPDLARDQRLVRIENGRAGEPALGTRFAVRASVAYKGSWVRRVVTIERDATAARAGEAQSASAAAAFADAVARLPDSRALSQFASFMVEGCRLSQPLETLMGSHVAEPRAPAAGDVVSVQACIESDGGPILFGAPALLGARGEAASTFV